MNHILTAQHGKRIAVIENEFGEIGVDQELVINAEEEIFEMNNGCICCTVRGDLIRILGNLMKRKDRFDYVMIETTGLADPGPVAQTFFVDDEMQSKLALDGIVTVVDAKHVWQHIDTSDEVKEQIAFADVILLNKTDLVTPDDLDRLEARIKGVNAAAKVIRCKDARVEMDHILNVGGFNLDRALEVDPKFMEPEYPFEWGGIYHHEAGSHALILRDGPDPTMDVVLLPVASTAPTAAGGSGDGSGPRLLRGGADGQQRRQRATRRETSAVASGRRHVPLRVANRRGRGICPVHAASPGGVQGRPAKPCGQSRSAARAHEYKPDHEHDEEITSVGITIPGDLSEKKLNAWLGELLMKHGPDIFRMKGVLSIMGEDRRYVFQGVHMLFDGRPDRPWGRKEQRHNALIFIGRNLDRAKLEAGFQACLA